MVHLSFGTNSWRKIVRLGALTGTGKRPEKAADSSGEGLACKGIAWTSTHSLEEEGSC